MKSAILILSYNHAELTSCCVQSILDKAKSHDSQDIYLIHNGSLEKNVLFLKEKFPTISHFAIKENQGYANGVNQGLTHVFKRFDRVIFFTNDTELLEFPEKLPDGIGIYAPLIYFRKKGRIDSLGAFFYPHSLKLEHSKSLTAFKNFTPRFFLKKKIPYVPGTAFVIDKKVFEAIGGMDESLHTYWEDVDFSVKAYFFGHTVGTVENLEILHKVGKTCHKKPFYTTYLFKRNQRIVSVRHSYFILKPIVFLRWFITFSKLFLKYSFSSQEKSKEKISLLSKTLSSSDEKISF